MKVMKILSLALCAVLLIGMLTGCASRTPATGKSFQLTMEAAGFTVKDVTAETETNGMADTLFVAYNEEYQIEFWDMKDAETGKAVFGNVRSSLSGEHAAKLMKVEATTNSYGYYAFTADGNFHVIARIEDTILLCEAGKEHKDAIVDILKQLGYR